MEEIVFIISSHLSLLLSQKQDFFIHSVVAFSCSLNAGLFFFVFLNNPFGVKYCYGNSYSGLLTLHERSMHTLPSHKAFLKINLLTFEINMPGSSTPNG